jgi:hypothetical protein
MLVVMATNKKGWADSNGHAGFLTSSNPVNQNQFGGNKNVVMYSLLACNKSDDGRLVSAARSAPLVCTPVSQSFFKMDFSQ